jgi:hypothetical protein
MNASCQLRSGMNTVQGGITETTLEPDISDPIKTIYIEPFF